MQPSKQGVVLDMYVCVCESECVCGETTARVRRLGRPSYLCRALCRNETIRQYYAQIWQLIVIGPRRMAALIGESLIERDLAASPCVDDKI